MIKIYYGPTSSFEKIIPSKEFTTLTKLITDLDLKNKQYHITTNQDPVHFDSEIYIENLVASTEEYSRLSESGINAFVSILNEAKIINEDYIETETLKEPVTLLEVVLNDVFSESS